MVVKDRYIAFFRSIMTQEAVFEIVLSHENTDARFTIVWLHNNTGQDLFYVIGEQVRQYQV